MDIAAVLDFAVMPVTGDKPTDIYRMPPAAHLIVERLETLLAAARKTQ